MKMAERVAASRDSLTTAALELMADDRPGKVSISEVCRRANVTRPTFYQYFGSVDDLLGQVVAERLAAHQDAAFALDPEASDAAFAESLERFLDLIWTDRRLVGVMSSHAPDREVSRDKAIEAIASRILQRTKPDQEVTAEHALSARFAAAGTVELLGRWLSSDDPGTERATYAAALQHLTQVTMADWSAPQRDADTPTAK